ncbi:MAG: TlpA family protein disulfide reductase [Candidatus Fibromonas sp.]|jgi:alkyl hydroperoxide reductase subunit AhpC|nr:TlpA family protein disulfide reductase [Candidatus Fibromonas sp.]
MQIKPFILALVLLPLLSFAGQSGRLALPKKLQNGMVPNFFVLSADNKSELYRDDIKDMAKKSGTKRIVLSFFATWCVSCREEFTILKKNADELKKRGVQVYLINVGEDIHTYGGKVNDMVKEYAGNSFPCYFDPNAILHASFGLVEQGEDLTLPLTLVLDSNLRALGILVGKMGDDFPQILWEEF